MIDLFEEARGVELDERLATQQRGHFTAAELLAAATAPGTRRWAGTTPATIAVGKRADLVAVALDSARTAGVDPAGLVFAATAADVTARDRGRPADRRPSGRHTTIDVPRPSCAPRSRR